MATLGLVQEVRAMKVLFVGQNPARASQSDEAFNGTRSGQILLEWVSAMGITADTDEVLLVNACEQRTDNNRRPSIKAVDPSELLRRIEILQPDLIFAVGDFAASVLRKAGLTAAKDFYQLAHPSGLNRKINDGAYVEQMLEEGRRLVRAARVRERTNGMKILFLDFDGVIGNFDKYLYQTSRPTTPALATISDTYMPKRMDYKCIEGFDFLKAFLALPPTWPGELEIIPGSHRFMAELRRRGVKVVLLTSIPDKAGIYRLNQMVKEGLHFDEAYFTMGQKKSDFVNLVMSRYNVSQAILIDDMAKNAIDVAERSPGVDVVTCDIPYNQEIFRAASTTTIERLHVVPHVSEDMEATARAMQDRVLQLLSAQASGMQDVRVSVDAAN